MRKAFIWSSDCVENILDSKLFGQFLKKNNWLTVEKCSDADLIIVNTCAFNKIKEDESIAKIIDLQRQKRIYSKMIVCGCLPSINPDRLKCIFKGDTFGPTSIDKLQELIGSEYRVDDSSGYTLTRKDFRSRNFQGKALISITELLERLDKVINLNISSYSRYILASDYYSKAYYIKIAVGCLGKCSYCAIKNAKGGIKSKPIEKIIHEFQNGLQQGYKKFVLTADDTGAYGKDIGTSLPLLLRRSIELKENYEIYIRNLEPNWLIAMFSELKELFGTGRISYIQCPAQSGNNRILRLMNRDYTIEDYKRCLQQLNKEMPSLMISTYLMVGFPSENEKEFNDTLKLLEEVKFTDVQVFEYNNRLNTEASYMDDQVCPRVKTNRYKRLYKKVLFTTRLRNSKALLKNVFKL